jgi:hypothetical protein
MKKKFAILLGLIMVMSFSFAACGSGDSGQDLSDSKYLGEWVASGISVGDESEDIEGGVWKLTLKEDGTGTFVSTEADGTEEVSNITWELTDEGFKTKGDTKLTFKDNGDTLSTKIVGVELSFVRPGEEGPDDGAPDIGTQYGYMGQDPAECAVWKYLATEIASQYDAGEGTDVITVPVVRIIKTDRDNDDGDDNDVEFYGDFWVNNYVVEGDTLKCVSGGDYAGKIEVIKTGDEYTVKEFEQVQDGGNFEPSARDIFEEDYDAFMKVYSDTDGLKTLRTKGLSDYVKTNGLSVTKYQDEGWDPVDLDL